LNKINEILEGILTIGGDASSEAVVYVGVRKDTGEVLGGGLTEEMAMGCSIAIYSQDQTFREQKENEANAHNLVSLVKVPLW
jgi:hypothetical protein